MLLKSIEKICQIFGCDINDMIDLYQKSIGKSLVIKKNERDACNRAMEIIDSCISNDLIICVKRFKHITNKISELW